MNPSASQIKAAFPTEEALCNLFTQEMEQLGWTVYPETGGFDLLLVWEATGHQLGGGGQAVAQRQGCRPDHPR